MRQFDLGNLVHRRAAASALASLGGDAFAGQHRDLVTGLDRLPGTLTPELRGEFEQVVASDLKFSAAFFTEFEALLKREPAANGTSFVEPQDSMHAFLRECSIGPNEGLPGITEGSARVWGSYLGQETKGFREPRSLAVAREVAFHADMRARGNGQRVDPLEFAAHIYPELRMMLEEATRTKNVVYVKPPAFMAHLPFREHTFQNFAAGLASSGLAQRMGEDVGVAIERLQTYVADTDAKITPYVSTLKEIARAIALDAIRAEDGQYAREVFRYLMVLRMRDYLTVEEDGVLASLVPIEEHGLSAMRTTARDVVSRFSIIVKPDMSALHGSGEIAKHARRWRWIDRIMGDHYEQRISEWESRLASFDAFDNVAATHHDGSRADLRSLRIELGKFRMQHNAYKRRLERAGGAHDALTHDEVAECVQFYGTFDSAFQRAMFFTHVRGEVQREGRSISYEVIARPSERSAVKNLSGFTPVYGGDVFAQDWDVTRQEALITLRAIRGYLARTGQLSGSETRFAEEVLTFYWPGRLTAQFRQALTDLGELGGQDLFAGDQGATLPRSSRQSQDTARQPDFFLYDSGYAHAVPKKGETKLQAMVRNFYDRADWSIFAKGDSWVVQQYLSAVRYPHYVYDSNLLASLIGQANTTGPAQAAARSRIETLFGAHSIKNEEAQKREQAGQGKVTARTLSAQAFTDYRKFFSAVLSHGLELPVEDNLVLQIAQGLAAKNPTVKVNVRRIGQGLIAEIGHYNRALCRDARRLTKHKLYPRGLFDVRFGRFVDAWLARSGSRELPLDRRTLISIAQTFMSMANGVEDVAPRAIEDEVSRAAGDVSSQRIAETVSFLTSWLKRQRRDATHVMTMLGNATHGIETFLENDGQRYRSPVIPTSDFIMLAKRAVRRRLSISGPIDGRSEALDVLGGRFEFLPKVREHAARFMQAAVAHYLAWLRTNLGGQLGVLEEALELMADGEHGITAHNDFVQDLSDIADASVPLDIFHGAYPSLRALERVHRIAGELSSGNMPPALSVSNGVASIVRRNRERMRVEQERMDALLSVVRARVERAQSALTNGRREVSAMGSEVARLMHSRAERVVDGLTALGSRIPDNEPSRRSPAGLRRQGRIAHHGAMWVSQELDLHASALMLFVRNLQVQVVDPDITPLRDRLSDLEDRLIVLGIDFEEARDAVGAEQDRRARAAADERARVAAILATDEMQRLGNLVSPDTFVVRLQRVMDRLDDVESSYDDQQSYLTARATLAADRREARRIVNFINHRLASIVNGIEIDHQPADVIARVRLAASEADRMRARANSSAQGVMGAWERVKKHAEELTKMRARVVEALKTTGYRLENAERALPPASDIDMTGINRVVGRVRNAAGRDGAHVTMYMAKPIPKKFVPDAKQSIDALTRSIVVLTVGGRGHLVEMDGANQRRFDDWRDGGRQGQLLLASVGGSDVAVPEGSWPVYTTSISSLSENHSLGRLAAHFAALKDKNTPARAFVAWVHQQRRNSSGAISRVWDHIVARLADPELQTEDVSRAIAEVAAAMRHDVRSIDPSLRWVDVVTQYEPVTRPMFANERRHLAQQSSSEIDANMTSRVGGRSAIIHAMPHLVNAIKYTLMPKNPARRSLWRALFKGSKGPIVSGLASAAAAWALIERAERGGHPHAGALRHRLLSHLANVLFPSDIDANPLAMLVDGYTNDIARSAEEFYIELYAELEHPRLIHDETLGYGVARHRSVGGSVVRATGFAEGTLASQLISTIFQHNCYLPSGYALWRAFGNDGGSRELRDAMRVVFRRYGGYRLDESEPLSIHWMLEEMQDVLTTVEQISSEKRPLPAWWTTPADAQLADRAPEIGSVSWFRMDHTVRSDDSAGPRASIHNAAHRFVQLFPEFAGAVTIIETIRGAVGSKREYPFIEAITALYARAQQHAAARTLESHRDELATAFRKHYLSRLKFVRGVLTHELEGRRTLAEDLRIQDVVSRAADAAGGAVDTLVARRGARVNPLLRPSK